MVPDPPLQSHHALVCAVAGSRSHHFILWRMEAQANGPMHSGGSCVLREASSRVVGILSPEVTVEVFLTFLVIGLIIGLLISLFLRAY